jgi:hypothetical protein
LLAVSTIFGQSQMVSIEPRGLDEALMANRGEQKTGQHNFVPD